MLSNMLIVLGMAFFLGGINRVEQFFNVTVAQTAASLLALSVGSLIIPTAFRWNNAIDVSKTNIDEELSRGTSIILLVVYASYLIFQLKSHKEMYNAPSPSGTKRNQLKKEEGDVLKALAGIGGNLAGSAGGEANQQSHVQVPDTELEEPSLTFVGSLVTLLLATALIGVCAEFLVDSIHEVTCEYHVSPTFVGLILLPIVGNAAEHATAVTVAIKDKMDLAIGVAIGSTMQIALLVLPLMVILGWIIHADMTLVFDDFQIVVLLLAVILVNYLIGDGKSHWLEGVLLIALYLLIAVAAWFYPTVAADQC
jgi:Ca2+:H+ antiporter